MAKLNQELCTIRFPGVNSSNRNSECVVDHHWRICFAKIATLKNCREKIPFDKFRADGSRLLLELSGMSAKFSTLFCVALYLQLQYLTYSMATAKYPTVYIPHGTPSLTPTMLTGLTHR